MDRRDFIKLSGLGIAGLALNERLAKADALAPDPCASKSSKAYSVVILGDTHYDAAPDTVYHAGYKLSNATREASHRKEFVRNADMWKERCPKLVKRAACLVDDDTRMVVQLGDLVQGDTADSPTHKRFLDDMMTYLKGEMAPDIPLLTVVGNHDVRGNDDDVINQAYREYMIDRMSKETGKEITDTNFYVNVDKDVFIFLDFTHYNQDAIERIFKETKGARHTFVVEHCPALPYESAKHWWWFFYGQRKDNLKEERLHYREMLAKRNAIVLCGHVHTTEFADWYGDGGRITQMTMSSVWSKENYDKYTLDVSSPQEYGSIALNNKKDLAEEEVATAVFNEYRAGLKAYTRSHAVGSYKLVVEGKRVYIDFYAGDSSRRTERFYLR